MIKIVLDVYQYNEYEKTCYEYDHGRSLSIYIWYT